MDGFNPKDMTATGGAGMLVTGLTTSLALLLPWPPLWIAFGLSGMIAIAFAKRPEGMSALQFVVFLALLTAAIFASAQGVNQSAGKAEVAIRTAALPAPAFAEVQPTPNIAYRCFDAKDREIPCGTSEVVRTEPIKLKPHPALPEQQRVFRSW